MTGVQTCALPICALANLDRCVSLCSHRNRQKAPCHQGQSLHNAAGPQPQTVRENAHGQSLFRRRLQREVVVGTIANTLQSAEPIATIQIIGGALISTAGIIEVISRDKIVTSELQS